MSWSRTRGKATEIRRSRNSYIASPRSVTIAPMGMPSRSLNAAIDFFAFVMTGFCPAIDPRSATRGSIILTFCVASPRPMLMTIFSSFGTAIRFSMPSSFWSWLLISFEYFSFSRAAIVLALFSTVSEWLPVRGVIPSIQNFKLLRLLLRQRAAIGACDANLLVALKAETGARCLAIRVKQRHVRYVNRRLLLENSARAVALRVGLQVFLDHADALNKNAVLVGDDAQHASLLALVLAGDHDYLVVALNLCHLFNSFVLASAICRSRNPL